MPQKHAVASHIGEPTTHYQPDTLHKKIFCRQDLECTALQNKLLEISQIEMFSPAVSNRRDVIDRNEVLSILKLDCSQASYKKPSMHKSRL